MKNLLFLLLFIPLISYGQDKINLNVDKKVEITTKRDIKSGLGLIYLGSGTYRIGRQGNFNRSDSAKRLEGIYQKLKIQIIKDINEFAERNNYNYKITIVEK